MKKIFILLFGLAAATQVFAQASGNICSAPAASSAGTTVSAASGTTFNVRDFQPKCSANVYASFQQNTVSFVVGSASSKGKNKFLGTTGGGGVTGSACAGVTCVQTDATSALAAALAAAT